MTLSRRGLGARTRFAEQFAQRFPGGASIGRLLDQALDNVRGVATGLPQIHADTHLVTGDDPFQTPSTPRVLVLNQPGSVGDGPAPAREDHVHELDLLLTTKGDSLTHDGSGYVPEPVGADDTVLMADAAQPTGRIWSSIASIIGKLLTTKGDLLTRDATTVVRKGVGADGLQLTAASAETDGLRWGPIVLTPPQITADVDDYDPGRANVYRLDSDAYHLMTGLVAGTDGEVRYFLNVGANLIELQHEDAGSAAANRFRLTYGSSILNLQADDIAILIYDGTIARWRIGRL